MPKFICLYLHVHQPHRIRKYTIFDIGKHTDYFEHNKSLNKEVFYKVAQKSYYPTNQTLQRLLNKHNDFKLNLSITGTLIEQCNEFDKQVLQSFVDLSNTSRVEILAETYYHSLAALYSPSEFRKQTAKHLKTIQRIFNQIPTFYRNTELMYSDYIAHLVSEMGFKGIITEGTEKILEWRSPNYLYTTYTEKPINLMLKNYKLSDDIAWRFSQKTWGQYPLTADKYLHWVDNTPGETINLFMDYETFGEHQWEDTGIFHFLEDFVTKALQRGYKFINISEAGNLMTAQESMSSPNTISWADEDRSTTAWTENPMQKDCLANIYKIEEDILKTKDKKLIRDWRCLQTSDQFYYMCTKWFNDGDVHAYFSPYSSPYEAYNNFNNALIDLKQRLEHNSLITAKS